MASGAQLAHERLTAGGRAPQGWIYFLHGFFGAGRNWRSVARRLLGEREEWGAVLVDLRLHGDSRGFPPPHTLGAAAADVVALVREDALVRGADDADRVLLGHSFGGKVALAALAELAEGVRQVWVIDSTPGPLQPEGSAERMLAALRDMPARFAGRDEAVGGLRTRGFDALTARWMATNLVPADAEGGGLAWRFALDDAEALLRSAAAADLWSVVETPPEGVALHFVKARDSRMLTGADVERLEAAAGAGADVRLHVVPGGHWVNVDSPDALHDLLDGHLPQPGTSRRDPGAARHPGTPRQELDSPRPERDSPRPERDSG